MIVQLNSIKIPSKFLASHPRENKVREHFYRYINGEDIEKEIFIDIDGKLLDGYARYLALVNHAKKEFADVSVVNADWKANKKKLIMYVYGRHKPEGKLYVWKVSGKTKNKDRLKVGSIVQVATKKGAQKIVVEKIEILDTPPVEGRMRSVKNVFRDKEKDKKDNV